MRSTLSRESAQRSGASSPLSARVQHGANAVLQTPRNLFRVRQCPA